MKNVSGVGSRESPLDVARGDPEPVEGSGLGSACDLGIDAVPLPADLASALDGLTTRRPDLPIRMTWTGSLPSTMDVVARAAEAGAPEGLIVGAETQTAGRGRRGRTWSSPGGAGLYFSYLARPSGDVGLLTLAAGVAVRDGIARSTGLLADLKWPNDLLVGRRKLAGLLAEGARIGTPATAVTIGVGINVRDAALEPDVAERATSLERELGGAVDRGLVLASVVEQLADALAALARGEADAILRTWRAGAPSADGTRVEWMEGTVIRTGVTAGIDDSGALLVTTAAGLERVIGGELIWVL